VSSSNHEGTRCAFGNESAPANDSQVTDVRVPTRKRRPEERARHAAQVRNKSGRRRLIDPTTSERDYSVAELEFMHAMQEYKYRSGRMFPTWSEVLEVLRNLGYQKDCPDGV
jgi:hypothetical protein